MHSNRAWLPAYCHPHSFVPHTQEARMIFRRAPYLFQDFVGKAITYLLSPEVRSMGFELDLSTALPCKWKCSDEALFGVDLTVYAHTGHYPFDKGKTGGYFNESALAPAVHHAKTNLDFGGSHVGYVPGPGGGRFGQIPRPLHEHEGSADCGHLMALVRPFKQIYDDACDNILLFRPEGDELLASVPNEYLIPSWSSGGIKLLIDLDVFATAVVPFDPARRYTHKLAGRSLLRVHRRVLDALPQHERARLLTPSPQPIGTNLLAEYFNIYDSAAELSADGAPVNWMLPYMKTILASPNAPYELKTAIINTNLEYNRLTDAIRSSALIPYSFASFTGVFIDMFDPEVHSYVNLFAPVGLTIKPAGRSREFEIPPEEIHEIFDKLRPAAPVLPLEGVLGYRTSRAAERFAFSLETTS